MIALKSRTFLHLKMEVCGCLLPSGSNTIFRLTVIFSLYAMKVYSKILPTAYNNSNNNKLDLYSAF